MVNTSEVWPKDKKHIQSLEQLKKDIACQLRCSDVASRRATKHYVGCPYYEE